MQLPDLSTLDTTPKLLLHNAAHWGAEVALREKEYGIWNSYSWADSRDRVQALALGLLAQGIERGDVVAIIGRNRPHWLWAELAAHSVGAMSLGIYEDALGKEVAYLLDYAGARLAFAEDEEQADKLLEIAGQLPQLRWIVYNDPRGMRKYADDRLLALPLCVNTGLPGPPIPGEAQNPIHLDRVCVRFPELKLCMIHGADPWWDVAIRLLIKYQNLRIMTSAWSPKRLPESLLHYMRTRGKNKVIFASDWPVLRQSRVVPEALALDLPADVLDNYLYNNANDFFFGSENQEN